MGKGANASVVPKVNFGGREKQRTFGRKPESMGDLPESNFNAAIGSTIGTSDGLEKLPNLVF